MAAALRPALKTVTENSYVEPATKKSGGKDRKRPDVKFSKTPLASLQAALRSLSNIEHCQENFKFESTPGALKSGSKDEDASIMTTDWTEATRPPPVTAACNGDTSVSIVYVPILFLIGSSDLKTEHCIRYMLSGARVRSGIMIVLLENCFKSRSSDESSEELHSNTMSAAFTGHAENSTWAVTTIGTVIKELCLELMIFGTACESLKTSNTLEFSEREKSDVALSTNL
jgi:hypothetical protein